MSVDEFLSICTCFSEQVDPDVVEKMDFIVTALRERATEAKKDIEAKEYKGYIDGLNSRCVPKLFSEVPQAYRFRV